MINFIIISNRKANLYPFHYVKWVLPKEYDSQNTQTSHNTDCFFIVF